MELKSCPFCGGTKNRDLFFNDYGGTLKPEYSVSCRCGAEGPTCRAGEAATKEQASTKWNERAECDELRRKLKVAESTLNEIIDEELYGGPDSGNNTIVERARNAIKEIRGV